LYKLEPDTQDDIYAGGNALGTANGEWQMTGPEKANGAITVKQACGATVLVSAR
jgi:hypothetical protein